METRIEKQKNHRVRERLQVLGTAALTDHELIELVVGPGKETSVRQSLHAEPRGLAALQRRTARELAALLGLGMARAARLEAAFELGRRVSMTSLALRPRFVNSRQIFDYVAPAFLGAEQEVFEILVLDARNRLLRRERISLGTLTGSLVHPREVFRAALKVGACALILIHNHPSGDPSPSGEDIQVTERLCRAGELLGIRVLDHIIVGDGRYVSLADRGHMTGSK